MSIFSGCGGGGGGQPVDSAPPNISDIQITPNQLGFLGGEVNVSAKADDPSGVSKVWLEVQKPNGNKEEIELKLVNNRYEGQVVAASNTRTDGMQEEYRVWIFAKDTLGNQTPSPGFPPEGKTFVVLPPLPPPEPPQF